VLLSQSTLYLCIDTDVANLTLVRITNRLTPEIAEVPLTSTIIKIVNMDLVFILSLLPIKALYIRPFTLLVSVILLAAELPQNLSNRNGLSLFYRYHLHSYCRSPNILYPPSPFSVRRSVKPLRESRYSIPIQTPLPSASVSHNRRTIPTRGPLALRSIK